MKAYSPASLASFIFFCAIPLFGCGQALEPWNDDDSHSTHKDPSSTLPTRDSGNASPLGDAMPVSIMPDCLEADPFICEIEQHITAITNHLRGVRPQLSFHAPLGIVARDWSAKQAEAKDIGHDGFPDARTEVYKEKFGMDSRIDIRAENVAYCGLFTTDPLEIANYITNMWANSPGHLENILGDYENIGVGVVQVGDEYYATQIFAK